MNTIYKVISWVALGTAALCLQVVIFLHPAAAPQANFGSVVSATFGPTQASSTNVVVNNTTSTKVIPGDARMAFWQVCNFGTSTVSLSFTNPATSTSGFHLNPQGSSTQTCEMMQYPT